MTSYAALSTTVANLIFRNGQLKTDPASKYGG